MSQAVHLVSNGIQGCTITDGTCQASRAASAGLLSCSIGGHKLFGGANTLLKSPPFSSNHRSNPDFSRHRRGSSRSRNRQHQEPESSETLDETDPLPSKNGSLFSFPTNQRHSATATPGRREKEIVELFRKVQTQLRERAALKEERKMEASQHGQQEQRGTVDSLLNLLRKHSLAQEPSINLFTSSNIVSSDDVIEPNPIPFSRPTSNFRRRSPVPRVKFQPEFSEDKDIVSEPKADFDEETAVEVAETSVAEVTDLASLKLTELKDLAKSRGLKGYSKLKKGEIVVLLSRGCS